MPNSRPTPPQVSKQDLDKLNQALNETARHDLRQAADSWIKVKSNGGKVVVVVGSGPNLHEGVTTMLAALIEAGLIDGIITSSAVVGHEMAGSLEMVKRVDGEALGFPPHKLASDRKWEVALLPPEQLAAIAEKIKVDQAFLQKLLALPGPEIIKVAGNMAYPTGYWVEHMARQWQILAQQCAITLEAAAGLGCDPLTMLGACARRKVPCLVSVTQMVGGGQVGLSVGDSVSITRRSSLIARLLGSADLIIESGIALTQEIHDGPFEMYTGHGIWSDFEGQFTYTLKDKILVRIDLDPQLRRAWELQRSDKAVEKAIDEGKPKAVTMNLPFRMEMSGFARVPGALPIVGDLGQVWPLMASMVCEAMRIKPSFMCYKQGNPLGDSLRQYIARNIKPLNHEIALAELKRIYA